MELSEFMNALVVDREQQPRRANAGALAIGTDMVDHYLVQPLFHAGTRFAALTVPAVVALDTASDAAPADFLAFPGVALHFCLGRRNEGNLAPFDAVEDDVLRFFRKIPPRFLERKFLALRQAVHHAAIPGVDVVLERL